jgi:glycosyltransferase involved in cell wall biosynthesis
MTTHLVSIIIPCYNAENWIGECIDSALSQTYSPIEVIVIDDGSTDNSLTLVKEYGNKIRWISCKNGGPSAARNKGVEFSKGKYIHDYISSIKLKKQIEFLEASNADVVYGDWCNQCHKEDGTIEILDLKIHQPTEDILYYTISNNTIHLGSCLYKREVLEKISGLNESLRIAEDYDFFIRLALADVKFSYQAGCHYFYRIYNANTASHGRGIELPNSSELTLDRASFTLEKRGLLTSKYRLALAHSYFWSAKNYLLLGEVSAANFCYQKCKKLSENKKFTPEGNSKFEKVYRLFGWTLTSKIVRLLSAI